MLLPDRPETLANLGISGKEEHPSCIATAGKAWLVEANWMPLFLDLGRQMDNHNSNTSVTLISKYDQGLYEASRQKLIWQPMVSYSFSFFKSTQ